MFNMVLHGDLDKLLKLGESVSTGVQLILTDVALMIQNAAKVNAPYQTGTLRRSINTDFHSLQSGIVIVGSPLAYARRREYENYKNPDRKFYLKRAYEDNRTQISDIIRKDLDRELK